MRILKCRLTTIAGQGKGIAWQGNGQQRNGNEAHGNEKRCRGKAKA